MSVEQLKLDPNDFGGFQTRVLTKAEAKERYCARRFCNSRGRVQIAIPGEDLSMWRILCGRHFVMVMIIQAAVLGDPSPVAEGKRLAEKMGIDPFCIPDINVPQIVNLNSILCDKCGKGMMTETVGMFSGRRFVHTCPDANDPQ